MVNQHSSPTGVCSSTSLHTSTWLCQTAATPLYWLIIPANTCPAGAALTATRFRQPWHREISKAFSSQLYGLSLSPRNAWRCPTRHNWVSSPAQDISLVSDVSSAVPVTRAGTRCGAVTLFGMLSTEQGQPWQPAATSRSTQQQSFTNRLFQQLRLEPVPKGGVVNQWQDPPEPPSKHHFLHTSYFIKLLWANLPMSSNKFSGTI